MDSKDHKHTKLITKLFICHLLEQYQKEFDVIKQKTLKDENALDPETISAVEDFKGRWNDKIHTNLYLKDIDEKFSWKSISDLKKINESVSDYDL